MEKHDFNLISKRRRIDSAIADDIPNLKGEGGSKVVKSVSTTKKIVESVVYRLYFKGLVSEGPAAYKKKMAKAGFGVAIYDEADNLLYEMKESFTGWSGTMIYREKVEIIALLNGLNDSIRLGVRNVLICCDDNQIYQLIIGREKPMHELVYLLEEYLRLRGKLASAEVVLVAPKDVKSVYRLARDAIVSESSSSVAAPVETCNICVEETDAELMFFNDECYHIHCLICVKKHVEVQLLRGVLPKCLEYGCMSEFTLESCNKIVTPKLIEMWVQKSKEDLIPPAEKVYCPYPSCSMLMSKTELSSEAEQSNVRACLQCRELFCIECKVPWHSDFSCADYKNLHPDMNVKSLANDKMWRQCVKCGHMIERSEGCNHMTCRCGYQFCYICGNEWDEDQRGACPTGCKHNDDSDDDYHFYEDEDDDTSDDDEDDDDDDDSTSGDDDDDDGSRYSREAELDGINFEDFAVYQPYSLADISDEEEYNSD